MRNWLSEKKAHEEEFAQGFSRVFGQILGRHRMGLLEGGQRAVALAACVLGSHDVERH